MPARFARVMFLALVVATLLGGAAQPVSGARAAQGAPPLRVGITPDFPPLIFKQGEKVSGIEAELAGMLGEELGRPVQFVELKWEAQVPSLLEGRTDIIMSSLTVTPERQVRVAFAQPFLKSGLVAVVRAEEVPSYPTAESILGVVDAVGFVPNTTSEAFVRKNFPHARPYVVSYPRQAVHALQQRWIAMFVGDAPTAIWLVAENESSLAGIWKPLNEERLAWAVRKDDADLLAGVNAALERFRGDGRLDGVLGRWLPEKYRERMR